MYRFYIPEGLHLQIIPAYCMSLLGAFTPNCVVDTLICCRLAVVTAKEMAQSEALQRQHQEELDRLSAQLRDVGDERRRGGSLCFSTCCFVGSRLCCSIRSVNNTCQT
jgi:hypothetical protein